MTKEGDSTFPKSPQFQADYIAANTTLPLGSIPISTRECISAIPVLPCSPSAPRHAPSTSLQLDGNQEPHLADYRAKTHCTGITFCLKIIPELLESSCKEGEIHLHSCSKDCFH